VEWSIGVVKAAASVGQAHLVDLRAGTRRLEAEYLSRADDEDLRGRRTSAQDGAESQQQRRARR
jgi:hypothetical protein